MLCQTCRQCIVIGNSKGLYVPLERETIVRQQDSWSRFCNQNCFAEEDLYSIHLNKWMYYELLLSSQQIHLINIVTVYKPSLMRANKNKECFYEPWIRTRLFKTQWLWQFCNCHHSRWLQYQGTNSHNWDRVLGRHGVGKLNSNSLLFLSTYAKHNLCIINTIFRFANKYTLSWMYLSSTHWHLHHNTSAWH